MSCWSPEAMSEGAMPVCASRPALFHSRPLFPSTVTLPKRSCMYRTKEVGVRTFECPSFIRRERYSAPLASVNSLTFT